MPPPPRLISFKHQSLASWIRSAAAALALATCFSTLPGEAQATADLPQTDSSKTYFATAPPVLRFTSLTTEHGLSQNSVFAIVQDPQGFLWFGTENGLNRFDGHEFHLLSTLGDGEESLQGGLIQDLAIDAQGWLWIATEGGGVSHMDPTSGALQTYHHDTDDPHSLASDLVRVLALDAEERLWVGTRSAGLQRLRSDGQGFDRFPADPAEPCALLSNNVTALLVDRSGVLWVGTDLGLQRFVAQGECFVAEPLGPATDNALPITTLYEDRSGTLWIATRQGQIYRRQAALGNPEPRPQPFALTPETDESLSGTWISAFAEDADGYLWIATIGRGLFRLDRASGEIVWVRGDPSLRGSLRNNSVRSLFLDQQGTLWVGMEQGGVSQLPATRSRLGHYRDLHLGDQEASLLGVFSLHVTDDSQVWVGTMDRGIFGFRPGKAGAVRLLEAANAAGLPQAGRVYSMTAGRPGEVLIGTSEGLLLSLDPKSEQIQEIAHLRQDPNGLRGLGQSKSGQSRRGLSIRSLATQPSGEIWAATWGGGVKYFGTRRDEPTEFRHDPEDPHSLSEDIVIALRLDPDGSLWAGTWSRGLNRLHPTSGRVERLPLEEGPKAGRERIASILRHRSGTLWVSTEQSVFYSTDDGHSFHRSDAFGPGIVYSLQEDDEGGLWAGGTNGLQRLDPTTGTVLRLRYRHGLQDGEFNLAAAAQGPDGTLIFGGPGGINLLRPADLAVATQPPAVVLTSLSTGSRSLRIPPSSSDTEEAIVLAPGERSLRLSAAVLDFRHPFQNRFAYRLEGPQEVAGGGDEWVEAGTSASFSFTNLTPGDYRLRVAGANGDGVWNRDGVTVPVIVEPRFLERLEVRIAALTLAGAILAFTVASLYRRRARHALRGHVEALEGKQRLLEAREQERLHLAQELHDGPLQTVHSLQLQLSRRPTQEAELPGGLKMLVQELRDYCARLRSPLLQPYGLAPAMLDFAERFRRQHPKITMDLQLEPDGQRLSEGSRHALFRIFQEALGNAVRHGAASHIEVRLALNSRGVELEIKDDGVGFAPPERWIHVARQGRLGILGMIERAESVGGTAEIASQPGAGTSVRIVVPDGARSERQAS